MSRTVQEGGEVSVGGQVTAKFITKLPAQYKVAEAPIAIPTTLSRYGLSQIINHLLGLDPPRPFDFIVQGDLLRQDLDAHLRKHSLSTETVVVVEYVPAVLPPEVKHQGTQEDWVSAIAPLPWGVATGSYDGLLRLWRDGEEVWRLPAHGGAIKGAASFDSKGLLVTVSQDGTGCVWQVPEEGKGKEGAPAPVAVLKDHAVPLECCACGPSGIARCVTAGWDGQLRIWALDGFVHDTSEQAVLKRRKTANQKKGSTAPSNPVQVMKQVASIDPLVPLAVLAHSASSTQDPAAFPPPPSPHHSITCVSWESADIIVSGSWDHSIKVWDPSISACVETITHSKPIMCLATSPAGAGPSLVAFGGPERTLRLWDRRSSDPDSLGLGSISPSAHSGWISALAWHPTSSHHLLSASHDGSIKLWDLRTSVPLHQISSDTAEMTKVLCCSWLGSSEFAWGGTDKTLHTASVDVAMH